VTTNGGAFYESSDGQIWFGSWAAIHIVTARDDLLPLKILNRCKEIPLVRCSLILKIVCGLPTTKPELFV
jgi:hypothetical protein